MLLRFVVMEAMVIHPSSACVMSTSMLAAMSCSELMMVGRKVAVVADPSPDSGTICRNQTVGIEQGLQSGDGVKNSRNQP